VHETAEVIHRDLKPENLLLDENNTIKISDFGVSFLIENGSDDINSTAGSNYFFSPEICSGAQYKGKKSDVWALGVTLFFMFFRKYPWNANNIPILYNKIENNE
jgi:serine/threonine protein kinase